MVRNRRALDEVVEVPGGVPVLSRGRHRRPRQGACFMEFASYLAGEAWSDHPDCTHPTLAFLARGVNDFTSDANRQRLAVHIPSVVGLTGDSPLIDPVVALRAAVIPMGVAAESAQRSLSVAVLACRTALEELGELSTRDRTLLAEAEAAAPLAMAWARDFATSIPMPRRPVSFSRRARAIVSTAVLATADALVEEPDALLLAMLEESIADVRQIVGAQAERMPAAEVPAGSDAQEMGSPSLPRRR